MDREKLKQIINDLKQVNLESELKIKDFETLDIATRIYNSENIKQENKPFTKNNNSDKPTEKQVAILQKNNIKITDTMTRKEVAQIIKELFDKTNKEKYGVEY